MKAPRSAALLLLAAGACQAGADVTMATGEFTLRNGKFSVSHGVAFETDGSLLIALSTAPFDLAAMHEDGRLDPMDISRHRGRTAILTLGEDGPELCIGIEIREAGSATSDAFCDVDLPPHLGIQRVDGRVMGAANWKDEAGNALRFGFNLPIEQQ